MECRNAFSISVEGDNPVTIPRLRYGLEIKSTACLLPRASRLNCREACAIFFREQL